MSKIFIYNTLTRKKEDFELLTNKKPGDLILMYNCGPTVYSNAHIGNLSSYLMADLIRRFLELRGYKVKQVKNITDVGHLISDGDEGEDKLELKAREENIDPYMIARKYEDLYLKDERRLEILEPSFRPRATENITEMLDMISDLEKKGYTYETYDGVYFDVVKYGRYGELSGNTLDKIRSGIRIEVNEDKKNPADFALWKKIVGINQNHIMKWSSKWGEGFPGWHIECSAMAKKYLGEVIDIHTGGEDNIFPHHECELAQTCVFTGKSAFAHLWMHKRHMTIDGKKMSKSLGNFLTLDDLIEKGINPLDFRLLILMSHYRKRSNFTMNGLNGAMKFRQSFLRAYSIVTNKDLIVDIPTNMDILDQLSQNIKEIDLFLNDDLNTPGMFAKLNEILSNLDSVLSSRFLTYEIAMNFKIFFEYVDKILAILPEETFFPVEIESILKERKQAREQKDWKLSDILRDKLLPLGFTVEDTSSGQIIKRN